MSDIAIENAPVNTPALEGVKLYVGNLSYQTNKESLEDVFGAHGKIVDCFIPQAGGRPRGFGFVTFEQNDDAEKAIEALNETDLDGRTIRVNKAQPKGSAPPRDRDDRGRGDFRDRRGGGGRFNDRRDDRPRRFDRPPRENGGEWRGERRFEDRRDDRRERRGDDRRERRRSRSPGH